MNPTSPYAPPQAWPRPGASYHLGWIPATPVDEPANDAASELAGGQLPDAVQFAGGTWRLGHEPDRQPPDPAAARRPGHRWVRAAGLLQSGAARFGDQVADATLAAYRNPPPDAALSRQVREALAARRAAVGDLEVPAPPTRTSEGIYR